MLNKVLFRFCQKQQKNVFFDIKVGIEPQTERIVFKLYDEVVPKTANNFRSLCKGHEDLSYKDSIFHRIIPQFMLQGGDITHHNGMGGMSIYGRTFPDENFQVKHNKVGLLSMANAGPNTNGSQFFITTVNCPWLDGKHTVFGEVVEGMQVVSKIEKVGSQSGRPSQKVTIVDCGEVE